MKTLNYKTMSIFIHSSSENKCKVTEDLITIVSIPRISFVNQVSIINVINMYHVSKYELIVLICFLNSHSRVSEHLNKAERVYWNRRKLFGYIGHNLHTSTFDSNPLLKNKLHKLPVIVIFNK